MSTLQERLDAERLPVETADDRAIRAFRAMGIGAAEIGGATIFGEPLASYGREALMYAVAYFGEKYLKASPPFFSPPLGIGKFQTTPELQADDVLKLSLEELEGMR